MGAFLQGTYPCKMLGLLATTLTLSLIQATAGQQCISSLPKFMATDRIIGGKKASAPIPWQVVLITNGWEKTNWCGGSILDSKTILAMIRAGSTDAYNGGQLIEIEKYIEYPKKMDPNTNEHDIIILKLKTPLKFNDNVQPICLATKDPADGQKCYISGWGVSKTGNMNPERYLKWDSEPIATQKKCEDTFGYSNVPNLICSGGDKANEGTCQGDSGGPLVCLEDGKPVLVGASAKCNPHLYGQESRTILTGSRKTWDKSAFR